MLAPATPATPTGFSVFIGVILAMPVVVLSFRVQAQAATLRCLLVRMVTMVLTMTAVAGGFAEEECINGKAQ
jgi:hypothetical protein